jgi:peptide-methionine (R)-S-oxide reductase
MYNEALRKAGMPETTTEVAPAGPFYYAEEYHQQYLHKVPNGYCGLKGTGVTCNIDGEAGDHEDGLKPLPKSEDEWRGQLSGEEFAVLRRAATERPFTGEYVDTEEDGLYACRACGNPLFDSDTKFHSGTGWPSFTDALPDAVEYLRDESHGMVRVEVRCARCHSHLGHVFDDGPADCGGKRYCMNSIALQLEDK